MPAQKSNRPKHLRSRRRFVGGYLDEDIAHRLDSLTKTERRTRTGMIEILLEVGMLHYPKALQ